VAAQEIQVLAAVEVQSEQFVAQEVQTSPFSKKLVGHVATQELR